MANRLRQAQAEAMAEARRHVPRALHDLIGCDLFCSDPIFAGICRDEWANATTEDGRSYRAIAHVLWPYHGKDRRTTVVAPRPIAVSVMVHELGHVLDWELGERSDWEIPRFEPVSAYATRNEREEFAEAFMTWCCYSPAVVDAHPYWRGYGWSQDNADWFDALVRERSVSSGAS